MFENSGLKIIGFFHTMHFVNIYDEFFSDFSDVPSTASVDLVEHFDGAMEVGDVVDDPQSLQQLASEVSIRISHNKELVKFTDISSRYVQILQNYPSEQRLW